MAEPRTMSDETSPRKRAGWTPPRGIRLVRDARRNNWAVGWRAEGRARQRSFPTRETAEVFARELVARRRESGALGLTGVDAAGWRDWLLVRETLAGASVSQLLSVWERHKGEVLGGEIGLTVRTAVERYLALRTNEGLAGDSLGQTKSKLDRLVASLGARPLVSLTHLDLRAWLAGTGFSGWSLVHHDKAARAFFARAIREGWLAASPMVRLEPPPKPSHEVEPLSVAHGRALFASLRADPLSARLALEAFGGVRYSGTGRIEPDEILWDERALVIPAAKSKDGKRHFLQGMPDNLWAWLRPWRERPEAWAPLTKRQAQYLKSGAFAAANVPHPHNVLRHSFCSYLIAWKKDAALCAHLMQHAAPDMLYRHYRGAASEADGKAWFSIRP